MEAWDGGGSHNHPAFGSVGQWFYQGLGGIRLDPSAPGFKHILIKPAAVGDLTWVKSSHNSIRGLIRSEWTRKDGTFTLTVEIPANTTATVHVPADDASKITEGGKLISPKEVIDGKALFEIGSGTYTFTAPLKQ